MIRRRHRSIHETWIFNPFSASCSKLLLSGVDTGGSSGLMNRGLRGPGGPERRASKILCKKIISLLAYTSGSGKQTTNWSARFCVLNDYGQIYLSLQYDILHHLQHGKVILQRTDCMKMFAKMPPDRLKMHQKAFGGRAPPGPDGGA